MRIPFFKSIKLPAFLSNALLTRSDSSWMWVQTNVELAWFRGIDWLSNYFLYTAMAFKVKPFYGTCSKQVFYIGLFRQYVSKNLKDLQETLDIFCLWMK